jgi:hypothetical protein
VPADAVIFPDVAVKFVAAVKLAPMVALPDESNVILAVLDDGSWMMVVLRVLVMVNYPF